MDTLFVFKIYLIYGLAFITLFFAILLRDMSSSEIKIAKVLPYLGISGLVLGFHEWSELYLAIYQQEFVITKPMEVLLLLKFVIAYLPLNLFAWKMTELLDATIAKTVRRVWLGLATLLLAVSFYQFSTQDFYAFTISATRNARLLFSLIASCVAGVGLALYSKQLEEQDVPNHLYFLLSGIAFFIYGLGSALVFAQYGAWVLVFRCVGAVMLLATLWQALKMFDLERKQQIEEALSLSLQNQKLKELGELSSAIAHEIKTPISSALMSCDLLEQNRENQEIADRQIVRIRRGLERAACISQEVLRYSHQHSIERERVHVESIVNAALDMLRYRLAQYDLTLDIDPKLYVRGDKALLEEVVINLVSNALDASANQRKLAIRVQKDHDKVSLKVRDWGTGMSPKILEKATQPFFTTKPKGKGTGMGLALVKQIATQHNGSITFSNVCPGLLVEFKLPGVK